MINQKRGLPMDKNDKPLSQWSIDDLNKEVQMFKSKTYVNWISQWGISIRIKQLEKEIQNRNCCSSDTLKNPRSS